MVLVVKRRNALHNDPLYAAVGERESGRAAVQNGGSGIRSTTDLPPSVMTITGAGGHLGAEGMHAESLQQDLRVPKTCATWGKALQSAVERSACAGPVLARPEVG